MTEYFAIRDETGAVVVLQRIRRTETATYPELLRNGVWIAWPSVMDRLFDSDPRDNISVEEAADIAARFGASL